MQTSRKAARLGQALALLSGGGLLIFGILIGDPVRVMEKAVKICLECIGIG